MVSNRLAFLGLGLACVLAAAGGSYVATRHSASLAAPTAAAQTAEAATAAVPVVQGAGAPAPVANSEPPAPPARAATAKPNQPVRAASQPATKRPAASVASAPAVVAEKPAAAAPVENPTPVASVPAEPVPVVPPVEERATEGPRAAEPETPTFEELIVASDSVIGLRPENTLSSERARVEDRVEARVIRDVRVNGRVAIPAGSRMSGSVVVVERGGKVRERARLGIRFHTLILADDTHVPISTETIMRFGEPRGDQSGKKIGGGAVAGAILGAIIGGGKGAAIGATAGAAGGSVMVMNGKPSEALFPAGVEVNARIVSPVTITVDR